ncbi:hypothetical protein AB1K70_13235 [Bremerella sp. JC770]|uniref:hypothetical protein n=1 Tax=Bremerella sp. JC770 TaxID=3232137 RepID=UPI00345861DC
MPAVPNNSNPYLSPASDPSPAPTARSQAAHGLGIASMIIITCGAIYLMVAVATIPISILMYRDVTAESESYAQPSFYLDSALKALIYEFAFAVIGSLLVIAGWSIRKRRNYWISVIGSVIGCLPLPLVILSFFPSAWALWHLSRTGIRQQFRGGPIQAK